MNRLLWWLRDKKALVRMNEDSHRALKIAHDKVRRLEARMVELEVALAEADEVSSCPGRSEHVRLARRVEVAEARAEGIANVVPLRPVPLHLSEPRGGDPA